MHCFTSGSYKAEPAFYHVYEHFDNRVRGVVQANPRVRSLIARSQKNAMLATFPMDVVELPMVVPPTPWMSTDEGGYLVTPGGPESFSVFFFLASCGKGS